jgi:hypothetical protein
MKDCECRPSPAYEDCQVEWLGRVLEVCKVRCLDFAEVRPSRIDTKSVEGVE